MRYEAVLIKKEIAYIDAENGSLCFPTENERLLDGFNGSTEKYILIEMFTKLALIEANKITDLDTKIWAKAEQLGIGYDFEIFRIK